VYRWYEAGSGRYTQPDPSLCDRGAGEYYSIPFVGGAIPLCPGLFTSSQGWESASQTIFHELLHHHGVNHPSERHKKTMKACYPGYEYGLN
jgi:hypothetical protein